MGNRLLGPGLLSLTNLTTGAAVADGAIAKVLITTATAAQRSPPFLIMARTIPPRMSVVNRPAHRAQSDLERLLIHADERGPRDAGPMTSADHLRTFHDKPGDISVTRYTYPQPVLFPQLEQV
jgi:hypothetical protein